MTMPALLKDKDDNSIEREQRSGTQRAIFDITLQKKNHTEGLTK